MNTSFFNRSIAFVPMVLLCLLLSSCHLGDDLKGLPECFMEKIIEIRQGHLWNPPAEIWKWQWADQTGYYLTADCCDQFNLLYDDKCRIICAPDGGWAGGGDGHCPAFEPSLSRTLLWRDSR